VPPNNNNTAWYPTSLTSDLIEDRRAIAELVSWDLMHVGLTGTLPSELGWLTNLVELYVPTSLSLAIVSSPLECRICACD